MISIHRKELTADVLNALWIFFLGEIGIRPENLLLLVSSQNNHIYHLSGCLLEVYYIKKLYIK